VRGWFLLGDGEKEREREREGGGEISEGSPGGCN